MAGYIGSKASVTVTSPETDSRYVNVTGDTMTGALPGTDLTLSGGVYLGGTGSANYLDDYEEGNWTPTFGGASSNPSVTYTVNDGQYIKVGQQVTVWFYLNAATFTSGAGTLKVDGLPFTVTSDTNFRASGSVHFLRYVTNYGGAVFAGTYVSASHVQFHRYLNSDRFEEVLSVSDVTAGNPVIMGTLSYLTDA